MKKFIPFLSIAFLMAACNSKPSETETRTIQSAQQQNTVPLDTAGLAQFQQWKAQNELSAAEQQTQEQPVATAPVKTVTVVREVRAPQSAPARKTARQRSTSAQERSAPVEKNTNSSAGNGDVANNTGSGTGTGTAESPSGQQETAKNDGWSNAKKGTVVGSAGGAVVGAVINKRNRAVGAVIGGVLGGAVGYGIGKKKDNKETQQQQ